MSFSSEILQKWEELIYVRLPKISDFFDLIYYFLKFFLKAGAGDPGHQKSALEIFGLSISKTFWDSFWDSSWLDGRKPKNLAPSILAISKKRNFTVQKAMCNDFWIRNLCFEGGISVAHINEFFALWNKLQEVQLVEGASDVITWRFTNNGIYSAASAYLAQFEPQPISIMKPAVWSNWAPPKCKFFAWLILQNKVWTADRLARRGWPNCGMCQLCKREPETAAHIMFKCRYSILIWDSLKAWLGLTNFDTSQWHAHTSVEEWWCAVIGVHGNRRKGLASLVLLTAWEIWNERNARVFRSMASMPSSVLFCIKRNAALWGLAGAKHLSSLMPRE